jgi:pyruvate-formate lyase-activating enzyme
MIDLQNYVIVERTPYFNFSIKLVIPSGCNMNCPFCFNILNRETAKHDLDNFKRNFMTSLLNLVECVRKHSPNRTISLDITGNEPTLDVNLMIYVLGEIKKHRDLFNTVVLTSNGTHIIDLASCMNGVVDIVNISVHHYDEEKRKECFGIKRKNILTYEYYSNIVRVLKTEGIKVTAVSVLYKELDMPFKEFIGNFTEWCKCLGFNDLRIRSNFYSKDSFFLNYLNDENIIGFTNVAKGLVTKKLSHNKFEITMLMGVESLIGHVIGVEAVVDDDGLAYLDYGKKYPIIDDYIKHIYVTFP